MTKTLKTSQMLKNKFLKLFISIVALLIPCALFTLYFDLYIEHDLFLVEVLFKAVFWIGTLALIAIASYSLIQQSKTFISDISMLIIRTYLGSVWIIYILIFLLFMSTREAVVIMQDTNIRLIKASTPLDTRFILFKTGKTMGFFYNREKIDIGKEIKVNSSSIRNLSYTVDGQETTYSFSN